MTTNKENTNKLENLLSDSKERINLEWLMASLARNKRNGINNKYYIDTKRPQITFG